jgi:hypothetical protein
MHKSCWQSDIHFLELIQDLKICGQILHQVCPLQVFLHAFKLGVIHSALGEERVVLLMIIQFSFTIPKWWEAFDEQIVKHIFEFLYTLLHLHGLGLE